MSISVNTASKVYSSVATYKTNVVNKNKIAEPEKIFSIPTQYGFKTDNNGILEPAFNVAAGIPKDIKIHIKMLKDIDNFAKQGKFDLNPVQATAKAWKFFESFAKKDFDKDSLLSTKDLASMPEAIYQSDELIFANPIEANNLNSLQNHFNGLNGLSKGKLSTGIISSTAIDLAKAPAYSTPNNPISDNLAIDYIKKDLKKRLGNSSELNSNVPQDKVSVSQLFNNVISNFMFLDSWHGVAEKRQSIKDFHTFSMSDKNITDFIDKDYIDELKNKMKQEALQIGQNRDFAADEIDKMIENINKNSKEFAKDLRKYISIKHIEQPKKLNDYMQGMSLNINA